ncbi:zinc ABC transporter substrate-binding protein [soil metagenome]
MSRRPRFAVPILLAASLGSLALAGCGSEGGAAADGRIAVEASFYPIQWMAQQVGGDLVSVGSLTKPGAEPHDLELTPRDVAALQDADVVAYLSGFQPAVDDAIDDVSGGTIFDAQDSGRLDLTFTPIEEGEANADEAGSVDPHFWLDPTRLGDVATAFAAALGDVDPEHAKTYVANAEALVAQLDALDARFEAGLADCTNQDLVTSHNAFGYLAQRYGLTQEGITGLTPEDEPSASDLAAVTRFVKANDVRTIYFETLVSPDIADTVAGEAGVDTAVLDPIEGLNDDSQGSDYLEVMASNLKNLQAGQPCP